MKIEFENSFRRLSFFCRLTDIKNCLDKFLNNKYMIASRQITNTKIFAFIDVLVFFKSYSAVKRIEFCR